MLIPSEISQGITSLVISSNDFKKNRIALQIQSLLFRMFDSEQEITNTGEITEDLEAINSLKNQLEQWLLEQCYKK